MEGEQKQRSSSSPCQSCTAKDEHIKNLDGLLDRHERVLENQIRKISTLSNEKAGLQARIENLESLIYHCLDLWEIHREEEYKDYRELALDAVNSHVARVDRTAA